MTVGTARALRDWALAAVVTAALASVVFVGHRNRESAAARLGAARTAAAALARGQAVAADLDVAGVVSPARPSPRYPFLRQRRVTVGDQTRPLGGARARDDRVHDDRVHDDRDDRDDKLLYDAALRGEREGAFADWASDGSGRAVAAVAAGAPGIAVAVTRPARPAPYPWLVMLGALGLGAVIAAAGALLTARTAGIAVGAGLVAVPAYAWGGAPASAAIVAAATAIAIASGRGWIDHALGALHRHRTALAFVSPAALSMLVLVATPFCIGLVLGFYDHHHGSWRFVGVANFVEILSGGGRAFDDPLNFWFILGVTVLWTAANVVLHVAIGVALALALRQPWLAGTGVFRMLLILPWAIPNYITALIWKGMFQGEYGAINSLLDAAGVGGVSWFSSWATAFAANVTTNTWLGFPFMMVVALGALESIPRDLDEAAAVDGAGAWQRFWHITLPHLRPALGPAVVLGSIWTFNMFNVIFLVSAGQPGGSTDILVTDAYRWAFERGERYGMAAAYGTIIFLVLLLWTVFGTRIVRREVDA